MTITTAVPADTAEADLPYADDLWVFSLDDAAQLADMAASR